MTTISSYINHIVLVIDESASMNPLRADVVKVADNQIAYLAQRSKELDQETRITVYAFGSRGTARCLIYDKDVLRTPSIAQFYRPHGMTALIDASMLAIADLKMTPEKYGEHSFLIYVITDGAENDSAGRPATLQMTIEALPDHWTIAAFVPDQTGKHEAKKFGFPADNIAIWDATTAKGVAEAGAVMREATENFMQARTRGVRGSRNLFQLNTVTAKDVRNSLTPVTQGSYALWDVDSRSRIDDFCRDVVGHYDVGQAYYQLVKSEKIQPYKQVAILGKDGHLYSGKAARSKLGLPDYELKVNPGQQDFTIFVQSTSHNRILPQGTKLLVFR